MLFAEDYASHHGKMSGCNGLHPDSVSQLFILEISITNSR
jgi:hypothetical protein